jgi:hypothetical protein
MTSFDLVFLLASSYSLLSVRRALSVSHLSTLNVIEFVSSFSQYFLLPSVSSLQPILSHLSRLSANISSFDQYSGFRPIFWLYQYYYSAFRSVFRLSASISAFSQYFVFRYQYFVIRPSILRLSIQLLSLPASSSPSINK